MAEVLELDAEMFDEAVSVDGVVVVDFWAPWCGPCRSFAPIFAEAAAANPASTFAALDIADHPGVAAQVGVRSVPTVMVFRDGVLVAEHVGVMSAGELSSAVRDAASLDIDAYVAALDSKDGVFPDGAVV